MRSTPVTLLMMDPPALPPSPNSSMVDHIHIPRPKPIPVANITNALLSDPSARLTDVSLGGQMVMFPATRMPVEVPSRMFGSLSHSSSKPDPDGEEDEPTTTVYPISSFILSTPSAPSSSPASRGEGHSTNLYHVMCQHPQSITTEHRSTIATRGSGTGANDTHANGNAEIGEDYHRLWALSRRRWGEDVVLPGHLQSVCWILEGLTGLI